MHVSSQELLQPAADEELGGVRRPGHAASCLLQSEEADRLIDSGTSHCEQERCVVLGCGGQQCAIWGQG